ncbi:chloride channel protein [bacterium]|nr:chloride channel protein [bacterium]
MEQGGHYLRFPAFRHLWDFLARANVRLTDAFFLNLLAVVSGVLVALFVYLFKTLINAGSGLIRGGGEVAQLAIFASQPWLVYLIPALGGLMVGLIFRFWGRHRRFRGVTAVIESMARRGGRLSMKRSGVELLNSGISIASGLSVGMEGPIVVAGSTIGSRVSDAFHLSAARRRVLLASGAAAGISAVFNAPIAGFFFAVELILGDFSKRAVAAVVLASVSANITMQALTGNARIFELPAYGLIHPVEVVNYVALGIICGLVAYGFAQFLLLCDTWFPHWRFPSYAKPMIGGVLIAGIALLFPEILGTGHETVETLLNGHYPTSPHLFGGLDWGNPTLYLLALCVAKLAATSITLGSGAAGGKFAPSLFMGATVGGAFGVLVATYSPVATENPAAYALVGMAAIFGSIAQAPITCILLVFEMTGNYQLILPMLAAGAISQVVFYSLRREGVFTHKLARMGVKFGRGKDLNILEAIPVSKAMHRGVQTITKEAALGEIRSNFELTEHHGFPVVDEGGRLAGMLTTSDLGHRKLGSFGVTAWDICSRDIHSLKASDNCHTAIALLEDYHIGRVPVVDDEGRPVGIITRTDIVGAYKLALQLRQREIEEEEG